MTATLIIVTGAERGDSLLWGLVADGALRKHGRIPDAQQLSAAAPIATEADSVVVVLAGENVAARSIGSAPRGEAQKVAAARLLFEDELAGPIENLHIAIGEKAGRVIAAAISAQIISEWREAFSAANIAVDLLTVDYLALPSSASGGTVVSDRRRIVAAINGVGFAIEQGVLPEDAIIAALGADNRFAVISDSPLRRGLPPPERSEWLGRPDDERLLLLFGQSIAAEAPINLLQGRFRERMEWRAILSPWRRAAALAAAVFAGVLIWGAVDALRAGRIADRWRDAAAAVHKNAFPDTPMSQRMSHARGLLASGASSGFAMLVSKVAAAAQSDDGSIEVAGLRYDAARQEFAVSIRSTSDAEIAAFKKRLTDAGVVADDSGGYRLIGSIWAGDLTVKLP
jgi:general secretion pathway protein L